LLTSGNKNINMAFRLPSPTLVLHIVTAARRLRRLLAGIAAVALAATGVHAHHLLPPDASFFARPAASSTPMKKSRLAAADSVVVQPGARALARATQNRPDDSARPKIKVWYVLPSDGVDESLDTDGTIARSIAVGLNWLRAQSGGRTLRVDTFNGDLDVGFFRMSRTDAEIAGTGPYVRDEIEMEMQGASLTQANRLDLVFYGGSSTFACSGAANPFYGPAGSVGALYLKAVVAGYTACGDNLLAESEAAPPGYWEFSWMHESMHLLGIVEACALHEVQGGHVGDSPDDLMYAGEQGWTPSTLDVGRDDYFGHGRRDCADLANSPYLESTDEANMVFAVEYFHAGFGHYFMTAMPEEIAGLDAGVFAGWQRTGQTFRVWKSGTGADVCRFFTTAFAPKSSHFYTSDANECEFVKHNPVWTYEQIAFAVVLPDDLGDCATGIRLYRMYNSGQTGAPNHRYTTDPAVQRQMMIKGFVPEGQGPAGVMGCVPG
jgi:hypothetical protein